jgi:hypothetical protein
MGIAVFPAAGGGVTQKVSDFTSTGTFVVPSTCFSVEVFLVAGGGAGGGTNTDAFSGGGGGGGAVIRRQIAVTAGASYTVTIGAGGAGVSGSTGSVGGDTSFGSLAVAYGGGGGAGYTSGYTAPSVRGTMGGYAGGGGNAGGGAGAFPIGSFNTGTQPFINANENATYSAGSILQGGWTTGGTNNSYSQPGAGIEGFGGGGAGSFGGTTSVKYNVYNHGGAPSLAQNANGTAGAANQGGGGSGTRSNGGTPPYAGGNGGSGFARVIYWS